MTYEVKENEYEKDALNDSISKQTKKRMLRPEGHLPTCRDSRRSKIVVDYGCWKMPIKKENPPASFGVAKGR